MTKVSPEITQEHVEALMKKSSDLQIELWNLQDSKQVRVLAAWMSMTHCKNMKYASRIVNFINTGKLNSLRRKPRLTGSIGSGTMK